MAGRPMRLVRGSRSASPPPSPARAGVVDLREDAERHGRQANLVAQTVSILRRSFERRPVAPPLMPEGARKAYELARDAESDARAVARALHTDATLSARLLKLANSPAFGGTGRIVGIQQAVSRVGMGGLRRLIMAASADRLLVLPGDKARTAALQARGPAVAIASMAVAARADAHQDAAFTAGLLHDIGWPLAYELMRIERELLPEDVASDPGLKAMVAETMHAELGARLATQWDLAPPTVAAIGLHHEPERAQVGARLTCIVAAGVALVDEVGLYPETEGLRAAHSWAVERLGLSRSETEEIVGHLRDRLRGLAAAA